MARYRRRLCLAVDLRHYSRHSYPEQEDAQYRLRLVVEHALRRARVLRVRAQQQLQGDGQLVVFPAGTDAVRAVPELVLGLRDGLYQSNRAPGAFGRLRMRAALGLGAVSRADRGYLGDCVVLVNRLVDADVVRGALEAEEHGDLALAVPDELYREVILPHGDRLPSAGFRQTDVVVPGKDFACRAWLHVPRSAPARDAGTEPVIWGHSPGRTALREFVVPALGAAHLAATVLSRSVTLREWVLPGADGTGPGPAHAASDARFDEDGGPGEGGPGEGGPGEGPDDGHRADAQGGDAQHRPDPHHAGHEGQGEHEGHEGHPSDAHHATPHHPDPHDPGAHLPDPHDPGPYHLDPYHLDPDPHDPHHPDSHHPDPYHLDPHHPGGHGHDVGDGHDGHLYLHHHDGY
ncbi:hypothetical protein G3I38_23585 [Streptomyces sp. SID7958]|uniref:Uncharacterized protein n=2 Tax=unclassified Streptomyces TaxID=2593676 RepID=A0A6G3R4B0_9ACTN|nr:MULTISPECIES: hypothetical protein [unclassified Streptomyces]NEA90304.1 hypothetical protein [Streptomyces sp. SID14436]NEC82141.1 hypothetical protein [Streptomyces sp. SID7958]